MPRGELLPPEVLKLVDKIIKNILNTVLNSNKLPAASSRWTKYLIL